MKKTHIRTGGAAILAATLLGIASCSLSTEEDRARESEAGANEQPTPPPLAMPDEPLAERTPEMRFARLALDCIHRQYPNKVSHVLNSADDVLEPKTLTPSFYGCYDWHSSVHGHWMLLRLWGNGLVPNMDGEIRDALSRSLTNGNIAGEIAYFEGKGRESFERPYGMAWFLQMMAEIDQIANGDGPKAEQAKNWLKTLAPLEAKVAGHLKDWLPKLAYPVRSGTHNQTAFAFGLMLDWARDRGDGEMEELVVDAANRFYKDDKNCPISYEPSGEDFLSPCLMEADFMRRVLDGEEYADWLTAFLPDIPRDGSADWIEPGVVLDASDGKLVHLDGVNLSRAWAMQGIASALPQDDPRREALLAAAKVHAASGIAAVKDTHYAGGHWLASFATYLVTKRGIPTSAQKGNKATTKATAGQSEAKAGEKSKATPPRQKASQDPDKLTP